MSEIDFSKVPVGTLVDCDYGISHIYTKFFIGVENFTSCGIELSGFVVADCPKICFNGHKLYPEKIRISAKNHWLPWFGGECPVPKNCMVEFRCISDMRTSSHDPALAGSLNWFHVVDSFDGPKLSNIAAYRLCESAWQTVDGVCNEME